MKKYFVNFSNHPSWKWSEEQLRAAQECGEIVDVPFPSVDEEGDEAYILSLAEEYVKKIVLFEPSAVLCQGEFCLSYQVVNMLKKLNITVLAACSKRCVKEIGDKKEVTFNFTKFRKY